MIFLAQIKNKIQTDCRKDEDETKYKYTFSMIKRVIKQNQEIAPGVVSFEWVERNDGKNKKTSDQN